MYDFNIYYGLFLYDCFYSSCVSYLPLILVIELSPHLAFRRGSALSCAFCSSAAGLVALRGAAHGAICAILR